MDWLQQNAYEDLLGDLVSFDSRSSNSNLEVVEYLVARLAVPGVRVSRQRSPDGAKENLRLDKGPTLASLSTVEAPGASLPGLVLCGHLDVVPADEPDWTSPPFSLTAADNVWHGRGTADMKGFVALACLLFEQAPASELKAPLSLLFTFDEEVGSLGAKHLLSGDLLNGLPRRVIIGEPTELEVVHTHKGHLRLRVVAHGRPAHSGFPDRGINALEPMAQAVVELSRLNQALRTERHPSSKHFPEVPFTVINLATLAAGSAVNVIPERAELEIGVRLLPGTQVEPLVARIQRAIDQGLAEDTAVHQGHDLLAAGSLTSSEESLPKLELRVERLSPPAATPADDEFTRTLCSLAGREAPTSAAFSSDAGWLGESGRACLLFGPGSITTAHRANEYLPRDEVLAAKDVLQRLIGRYCCPDS